VTLSAVDTSYEPELRNVFTQINWKGKEHHPVKSAKRLEK